MVLEAGGDETAQVGARGVARVANRVDPGPVAQHAFGAGSGPDLMRLAAAQLRVADTSAPANAAAWTSSQSAASRTR